MVRFPIYRGCHISLSHPFQPAPTKKTLGRLLFQFSSLRRTSRGKAKSTQKIEARTKYVRGLPVGEKYIYIYILYIIDIVVYHIKNALIYVYIYNIYIYIYISTYMCAKGSSQYGSSLILSVQQIDGGYEGVVLNASSKCEHNAYTTTIVGVIDWQFDCKHAF